MQRVITATEARVHFGDLLRRVVEDKETILVERGGSPQVVVLSVAEYERLLSHRASEGWRDRVVVARERVRSDLAGRTVPRPEDVIDEGRSQRDEQPTHPR
ncbi:MAG TPA: type II toxin-antitoxin system Phd/YefM family antitoxin [Thermoleophilia bacterium]|nr:type II toxin-antitoxin system Phd/YefM family antitoxin [Thermoleophilia bacterium]